MYFLSCVEIKTIIIIIIIMFFSHLDLRQLYLRPIHYLQHRQSIVVTNLEILIAEYML